MWRIQRACDLDLKKAWLPPEAQAAQTPFKPYLLPYLQIAIREQEERQNYR
jgi:hypothetical protein